ncbi:Polysaccharide export protein [Desulfovibrio ferrophilus]|uniref:Polysaccharide export protein n=1 Tax=Desulfovibrio ferrophilus TaxID=241368 RepID=A0A2Z6B1B6_9BACT|nr:Polysaccharide export protein [Desulfovibrio ferrophilus]
MGPGDQIDVSVWNDPVLSKNLLVRPDGMISFPLIGDVSVAGKTVPQVRKVLEESISKFVPNSPVTVILVTLGSAKVFVVGKVASPGEYVMNGRTTVIQAIAMAGGLTTFAEREGISVLREAPEGLVAFPFDYAEIEAGRNLRQNMELKPGDTVVVP